MNEQQARGYAQDANVRAFLRAIRAGESHPDLDEAYTALFGWKPGNGQVFNDFTAHPNVRTYETHDGQFVKNGKIDFTTAAGAYQIVQTTWAGLQRKYPWLRTFSPDSQDLAAICLIHDRGAIGDVLAGRIVQAIGKLGDEWASLPSATVGQPTVALGKVLGVYTRHGGHLAGEPATPVPPTPEKRQEAPMPAPPRPDAEPYAAAPAPQQEKPNMAIPAVLTWALPILAEAVPRLAKMFGSGSAVSERNIAGVTLALDVAKQAIGAANEQELVERIKTDPAAAQAVRDAVDANWAKIHAAHEESIGAARQFVTAQPQRVVILNMLFHEILALVMILISAAGGITALFYTSLGNEIKSAIVTLMLIGGWNGVKEFYFGGSRGSDRKTEIMSDRQQ